MFTSLATIWKKNQTWSTIFFFLLFLILFSLFFFLFYNANKINFLITVLLFWIELFYICLFLLEYNIIIFFFSQKIVERNYAYYTVTMYFRNGDDAPFNSDATLYSGEFMLPYWNCNYDGTRTPSSSHFLNL